MGRRLGLMDRMDSLAYEEQHKNRQGVVSAAQVRVADIAREVVGV